MKGLEAFLDSPQAAVSFLDALADRAVAHIQSHRKEAERLVYDLTEDDLNIFLTRQDCPPKPIWSAARNRPFFYLTDANLKDLAACIDSKLGAVS